MGIKATMTRSARHETKSGPRPKKLDETLASVMQETPAPATLEVLRHNEPFALPSGTSWAVLLLDTQDIGGLSKRSSSKNEAKGSIVNLISSDDIQTVATQEMLDEQVFGIIPSATSLDRMEEFSLLTQAMYSWAVVWAHPEGHLMLEVVASAIFAQAQAVRNGVSTLREVLGDVAWAKHSGESSDITQQLPAVADPDASEQTNEAVTGEEEPDFGASQVQDASDVAEADGFSDVDGQPQFDDEVDFVDAEPADFDDALVADETYEDYDDELMADESQEQEQDLESDTGFDDEVDYDDAMDAEEVFEGVALESAQQARDLIARRFTGDGLDLEISLEQFNASFGIGEPIPQIEVEANASDWLSSQVAQMNRQANADLSSLRSSHDEQLRMLYVNLMSQLTEQIMNDLSLTGQDSPYKAMNDRVQEQYDAWVADKDERIRLRKEEIQQGYEQDAQRAGEQAALAATVAFKERHRAKMAREQASAVVEIESQIVGAKNDAMRQILDVRQREAMAALEQGTTLVFDAVAAQRTEFLAAERELLNSWRADVTALIEERAQDDISRVAALEHQQRTVDEVSSLRQAQEDQLTQIRNEHKARVDELVTQAEHARQTHLAQMDDLERQWQQSLAVEAERTASQSAQVTHLHEQLDKLEGVHRAREQETIDRYSNELASLKSDREADLAAMSRMSEMQKRANTMLTVLIFALSLAMLAVGVIMGSIFLG